MLTKQFLSCFIDGVVRASLVIHNDCYSLNLPEILQVNIQMLVGVFSKGRKFWSNFVVQLLGLPSRLLTLSNERRGHIATAKFMKHRKTTCSGLSEGNACSVDANEMEVLSHSKGNPNVCIPSLCDQSAKLSHQNNDNIGVYRTLVQQCLQQYKCLSGCTAVSTEHLYSLTVGHVTCELQFSCQPLHGCMEAWGLLLTHTMLQTVLKRQK